MDATVRTQRGTRRAAAAAHTVASGLAELARLLPTVRQLPSPRVLVFAAGKGGAGKSSSTANVGAILAAAGYRTLVIDLDIQANQAALLGVAQDPDRAGELDDGRSFLSAVVAGDGDLVRPLLEVRPDLHLVAAGLQTRKLSDYLTMSKEAERQKAVRVVIDRLVQRHDIDIVILDSRPAGELLGEVSLLAADYIAIPLKTDALSWNYGFDTIARLYGESGASARLLGSYLFATGAANTRIQADTRRELEDKLGDIAPVFVTVIPHSEKAAKDQSESGLTADEYAMASAALARPFFVDPGAPKFANNSDGISSAYASLAVEIIAEMVRVPE
jgi:chromosome partitioning protein